MRVAPRETTKLLGMVFRLRNAPWQSSPLQLTIFTLIEMFRIGLWPR
jgi:hypothetical protein